MGKNFLTVCLNLTLQKTILVNNFQENFVNRSSKQYLDLSGKGINVSRVLQQLGENVVHLTHGGGTFLSLYEELKAVDNLQVQLVNTNSDIRYCYTLIDQAKESVTEIVEEGSPVDTNTEMQIRKEYEKLLTDAHTMIISGSKAPGYSDELFPWMVHQAKTAGVRSIIDYRGKDLTNSLPEKPDIIKPNLSEFAETFLDIKDLKEESIDNNVMTLVKEKIMELKQKDGLTSVITNGAEAVLFEKDGEICEASPKRVKPLNTIGCGDSFTAGLASGLHKDNDIESAITLAISCAGKNAGTMRPGSII